MMRGKRAREIRKHGALAAQMVSEASGGRAQPFTKREVRRFKKDYANKEPHTPPKIREITKRSFRIQRGKHG